LTGVFPVHDATGAITLSGAVLIEISDRKRLEAQRAALLDSERAARIEAERAATLKDQFLATLSHELRTPLNAILGWARIARQSAARPPELERPLEVIERNARAQAQLIEDLLDISRIVSGKMRLTKEAIELTQVAQAAVTAAAPAAEAKQIQLGFEAQPALPPIDGDPTRLQQVVSNLLSNAIKFTQRGGSIQVTLTRRGSNLELRVTDDGAGISPEFLPHVFDRFRQADSSTTRRHGGLGLGLSIVRQLVELHGGTVLAESPGPQKGASFIVSLPIVVDADRARDSGMLRWLLPEAALSGVRVLIVDDEPDAREFVGRILMDLGAQTRLAASVDEALDCLHPEPAHIIVSDISMPGRDGYELIHAVRQLYDGKTVPAIALTAFARSEDRMRALSAGFQLHVAKPVDPHELTLAVASLVGRTGAAPAA
ncbi:MAG TPA: ATP-binding protein, partial [Polyangiaceae bacterium]|nr:ATP-binding protein [Polyangiaceae bacterium]